MSKNVNIKKKDSFEYEDRISNVITTPKNKEESNKDYKNNIFNNENLCDNNHDINNLNTNTMKNSNTENNINNKTNYSSFSNSDMEVMNGIKANIAISNNESLITLDQQKLFETFMLFQKFISNQATNINCNFTNNNIFDLSNNNSFNNQNLNRKNNFIKKDQEFIDDKNIDYSQSDLIQINTMRNVDLVNSNCNIVNEFKRNFKNNYNTSESTDSKEKINFFYENNPNANSSKYINLNTNQEKLSINLNFSEKKNYKNNPEKKFNSINNSINENGFNRLKIKNKAISYDFNSEIQKKETNGSENNSIFKNNFKINKTLNTQNLNLEKDQHLPDKNNSNKISKKNYINDPKNYIQNSFENISDLKTENLPKRFVDEFEEIVEKNPETQIVKENKQINKKCNEKECLNLSFSKSEEKISLLEINNFQKFDTFCKIPTLTEKNEVKLLQKYLSNEDFLSIKESTQQKKIINVIEDNEINTSKINRYNMNFIEKVEKNHDCLNDNFENKILKINENLMMDDTNILSLNISPNSKIFENKSLRSSPNVNSETSLKILKNNNQNKRNYKSLEIDNQMSKRDLSEKNLITFGTQAIDNSETFNQKFSIPQFTIGLNEPSVIHSGNASRDNKDNNKFFNIVHNIIPLTTDENLGEYFKTEEFEDASIDKMQNEINDDITEYKYKNYQDDELDFFNNINQQINDRINLPMTKEVNRFDCKKRDLSNVININNNTKEFIEDKNFTEKNLTNIISTNQMKIDNDKENSSIKSKSGNFENLNNEKNDEIQQEFLSLKAEKENVAKLKQEYEMLLEVLNQEIEKFYIMKDRETKEFEKWKEEEIKKIKKKEKVNDIKLLPSGKVSHSTILSKRDKEEIECLKNIIAKMQEEFKIKEINNRQTIEKLKKKLVESNSKILNQNKIIEELTNKNNFEQSYSSNLIKLNNSNNNITRKASSNFHSVNKNIIYNNETKINNNINNFSLNFSPSMKTIIKKKEEINGNKINKSLNMQLNNNNLSGNKLIKINPNNKNSSDSNYKRKYNTQKIYQDLNREFIKRDMNNRCSREIKDLVFTNININTTNKNNKSLELTKKFSFEIDRIKTNSKGNNYSDSNNNILSEGNIIENIYDDGIYDLVFLEKYHPKNDLLYNVVRHDNFPDGKIVKFYENDKREVIFPSGVKKEIFGDGYQIIYFNNGDVKQVFPNGKQVYYFSEAKTIQTTFSNNLQVFKFENGQVEKHYPEGNKILIFPDGTQKKIFGDSNNDDT